MPRLPDPVWRSLLFVPVNVERFIAKAGTRGADGLILDLEDAVALGDKESARALIPATVQRLRRESRGDILVRINQPLELAVRDLEAATQPDVAAILVTKAEGPEHLRLLDELVTRLEVKRGLPEGRIRFMALVESPAAVLQAYAIAKATPRTVAMSLGAEDYATAVGGTPSEDLLLMPKQQILQAARAAGIMPMGTLGTLADFSDIPAYEKMVRRSASFGFAGSSAIHPTQVPVLNRGFSPSPEEIAGAEQMVALDKKAAAEGRGSFQIAGKMIDIPVVDRAKALLARAAAIKVRVG
jgi:citrate lyase subunit beta / citryl-CoA lyase